MTWGHFSFWLNHYENSNVDYILGFKVLKSGKYASYKKLKQMMIILSDFSVAMNQNISKKEA